MGENGAMVYLHVTAGLVFLIQRRHGISVVDCLAAFYEGALLAGMLHAGMSPVLAISWASNRAMTLALWA